VDVITSLDELTAATTKGSLPPPLRLFPSLLSSLSSLCVLSFFHSLPCLAEGGVEEERERQCRGGGGGAHVHPEPKLCVPIRKVKRIRRADGPIRSFLTGQISHFRLLGVADEPKTVYKTTSTEDLESIVVALMNRRNLKLAEEVLVGDGGEEKEGAAVADGDEQHAGMEDDGDDDESPSYRLSTCHFPLSD
jgi:hypothetical protein